MTFPRIHSFSQVKHLYYIRISCRCTQPSVGSMFIFPFASMFLSFFVNHAPVPSDLSPPPSRCRLQGIQYPAKCLRRTFMSLYIFPAYQVQVVVRTQTSVCLIRLGHVLVGLTHNNSNVVSQSISNIIRLHNLGKRGGSESAL